MRERSVGQDGAPMPGVLVNARHAANGAEVMIRREGPATAPTGYRVYVDGVAVAWIAGASSSEAYEAQAAYLAAPGSLRDELGELGTLPLVDVGGYLTCGCHGSQREHSCRDERGPAGGER